MTASYSFPVTAQELREQGYDYLKYDKVVERLREGFWRQQETNMHFVRHEIGGDVVIRPDMRIEWWNKGSKVLLIYVEQSNNTAVVYKPLRSRQFINATSKPVPKGGK